MDNRHALIVDCKGTQATGTGERDAGRQASPVPTRKPWVPTRTTTPGALLRRCAASVLMPHVAQNTNRTGGSAIDSRTTRHEGYAKSINARRGIEKVLGWI